MEKDKNQVAILGGPTVRREPFPERRCIGSDERNAVLEVLDSQVLSDFIASPGKYFNGGRVVKKFESIWSEKYNFKHAISVNSWTSGLMSIVGAIGIEPGGEVTGSIDESARHAITKLSHYHFPSTKQAGKNIVQMGEREECVFPYGCPSADVVYNSKEKSSNASLNMGVGAKLDLSNDYLLVLFHPVTTEFSDSEEQMEEVLSAIKELNMQTVLIWPNIDAGSDGLSQAIRRFREENSQIKLRAYKNFEPEEYIPLLGNAVCAIGNSSSFIRDASFLGTPIVLVGSRQDGREHSDAVVKSKPKRKEIIQKVKIQLNHGRYKQSNLYGQKGTSLKIVRHIKNLNKYHQKKFNALF